MRSAEKIETFAKHTDKKNRPIWKNLLKRVKKSSMSRGVQLTALFALYGHGSFIMLCIFIVSISALQTTPSYPAAHGSLSTDTVLLEDRLIV